MAITQEKFPTKEEIANLVLQRLGQVYRPTNRFQNYALQGGYFRSGKCSGPHRIDQCDTILEPFKSMPIKKWCQMCQWNYTHETKDCNRIGRQQANPRTQAMPAYQPRIDQARPILGNQPMPPGTTGLRYMSAEVPSIGLELVSAQPYFQEPEYSYQEQFDYSQESQLVELPTHGEGEPGSLMLLQTLLRPRMPPVRKAGPCFGCGGDHWLRDCPNRPVISYKGDGITSM